MRSLEYALLLSLLCSASVVLAAETPSLGRGIAADKLYQFGEIDSVDLQSGALSVTVPLGITYPVSEHLSYSFRLTGTSRAWDFDPAQSAYLATPNRLSNSGIGWSLHFGMLLQPEHEANPGTRWRYISPDGGEHDFWDTLHAEELNTADGDTAANLIEYTRDSTYLRLKHSADLSQKIIEFPDGTIQTYLRVGSTNEYLLYEIRDRYPSPAAAAANWVHFDYSVPLTWTITDSLGRSHTVKFINLQYDASLKPMIDYVDLEAFDGTRGRWNISYLGGAGSSSTTIHRDCHQNSGGDLSAPVLASVAPPLGGAWTLVHFNDANSSPTCRQSVLQELTYPTGGKVLYDYTTFELPVNEPDPCAPGQPDGVLAMLRIAKRTFRDTVVTDPPVADAEWSYDYQPNSPPWQDICGNSNPDPVPAEELTVTVTNPLKDKSQFFFSVWTVLNHDSLLGGFKHGEYGLPFTRYDPVSGRFLSSIDLECDPDGDPCVERRYHYVNYEQDSSGVRANRRVKVQRTLYDDDNGTWGETASSDFDGVGNYRQSVTSGTFATGNSQTTTTNFNPTRHTYPGTYVVIHKDEPWILGTYDQVDVTGGAVSDTTRTKYEFDMGTSTPTWAVATGFLKSIRIYKSDAAGGLGAGGNDLLTLYCADSQGNVGSELSYGGDGTRYALGGTLPTCAAPSPSGTLLQYRLDHAYSGGVRSSSQYNGATYKLLDLTINSRTGLTSSSRDAAGVETQFTYDDLGRMTRSLPMSLSGLPRDAQTEYTYPASNVIEIARCAAEQANCTSNRLTFERQETTGFGQIWHIRRTMPAATNKSVQVTRYNAMGWKERESVWFLYADGTIPNETSLNATI